MSQAKSNSVQHSLRRTLVQKLNIFNMKTEFNCKALGAMVSSKRKWDELGLRDAAKLIGTSPATLSRVENGKLPDLITCKMICNWLHVDMNYFFNKVKNK